MKNKNSDDIEKLLDEKITYGKKEFLDSTSSKPTRANDFKNWKEGIVFELKNRFLDNAQAKKIIKIHNLVLYVIFPPKPKNPEEKYTEAAKKIISELEDIKQLLW